MKYWNKNKKYKEIWTSVKGPKVHERDDAKRWCQQSVSKDRFYFGPYYYSGAYDKLFNTRYTLQPWYWLFENPQDALAFSLKWSDNS